MYETMFDYVIILSAAILIVAVILGAISGISDYIGGERILAKWTMDPEKE